MADTMISSPMSNLSDEQIEQLGKEFDAIHDEVFAELGDRDRRYIVSMIEMHRRLVVTGRILLYGSRNRAAWFAGTSMLALAKILENMEIGQNVMHGQWDWMNDPQISSATSDWDTASTAEARELKGIGRKAWLQVAKDYLTFPALTAVLNTGATAGARALRGGSKSRRRRAYERVRPPAQEPLLDVARASFTATLKANFTANI